LASGKDGNDSRPAVGAVKQGSFPRLSISISGTEKSKKRLKVVAAVVAAILLIGITLAVRSLIVSPGTEAVVAASPSPTVEPTPSPLPTTTPVLKQEAAKPTPTPSPTPEKKGSKVGKVLKKVGNIFKKPF
jgi:hypothetical protein